MPYAVRTHVPVEKTRSEIEQLVKKYGAKGFVGGWHEATARVEFLCQDRHIRLTVPVSAVEQENRAKWRLLLLLVKAKLAAVDAKVVTFEQAFVGDIVMPETGKTVWESVGEPVRLAYQQKKGTILLPGYEK
jgi:hypothetical protein